jgi:hypothetical protein
MFVLGPMSGCHRAPDRGMTFAMRSLIAARRGIVMALAVIAVLFLSVVSSTARAGAHEDCSGRRGPGGSISGDDADTGPGDGGGDDCTPAPVTTAAVAPAATSPAPPTAAAVAPAPAAPASAAVVPPKATASTASASASSAPAPAADPITVPSPQPGATPTEQGASASAVDAPSTASAAPTATTATSYDAVAAVPAAAPRHVQLVGAGTDSRAGKVVPCAIGAIIGLACLVVAGLLARRDLRRLL